MRDMKTRFISFFLFMLAMSCFVACSSDDPAPEPEPEPEPEPQEEYPVWEPYNGIPPVKWQTGSKCTHSGKKWESMVDNNVWEPGAFGVGPEIWKEVV